MSLATVSPATIPQHSPATLFTLAGTGFHSGCVIHVDGAPVEPTTWNAADSSLSAAVSATVFASAGLASFDVRCAEAVTNNILVVVEAREDGRTWFIPALTTDYDYDSYVKLANPGMTQATVSATLFLAGGGQVARTWTIPPRGHRTVNMAEPSEGIGPGATAMAWLTSTQPVAVVLLSASTGAFTKYDLREAQPRLSDRLFLPSVRLSGFESSDIILANPGERTVQASIRVMEGSGDSRLVQRTIPPRGVVTYDVDANHPNVRVVAEVTADEPVVATGYRVTVYADASAPPALAARTDWVIPVGSTNNRISVLTVHNPGPAMAMVDVTFHSGNNGPQTRQLNVDAGQLVALDAASVVGSGTNFHVVVDASAPVVVDLGERRDQGGVLLCEAAFLQETPWASRWVVAGTVGGFDNVLRIANPGATTANVMIRTLPPAGGGSPTTNQFTVAPGDMVSHVVSAGNPVGVEVTSDIPVSVGHVVSDNTLDDLMLVGAFPL